MPSDHARLTRETESWKLDVNRLRPYGLLKEKSFSTMNEIATRGTSDA
jgi:hypothetical protein